MAQRHLELRELADCIAAYDRVPAGSGAAALVAGEAVFGEVPDDVVDACRRHGLVLIAVPVDVSFGTVTETVVGALSAARGDRRPSLPRQP